MRTIQRIGRAVFLASIWVAAGWLAAGCGTAPQKSHGPPGDVHLERLNRSARAAFANGQIDQAAQLYRRALDQALLRADAEAILDARYNLAACLMTLGEEDQALAIIEEAQAELKRDGRAIPADVLLLRATILYRSERYPAAWQVTEGIVRQNAPPLVLQRTSFLQGLIADAIGDEVRLRMAIERMAPASEDTLVADRTELTGRLAMQEGRWDTAIAELDRAADLRRQNLDYRRMAICLALSAKSCEKSGRLEDAARRYLEAGRSATLSGAKAEAVQWLNNAIRLSDAAETPDIAKEARIYRERIDGK
jgi:tetratricopeptide (TPR) repeat protein